MADSLIAELKTAIEITSLVAVGSFFAYKARNGYLLNNLSMSLSVQRTHLGPESDILVLEVALTKGDRSSARLHDIRARIASGEESIEVEFVGYNRLSFKDADEDRQVKKGKWKGHVRLKRVVWKGSKQTPWLTLSPGESATYSCYCLVPRSAVCTVEAVALASRPYKSTFSQWRCSRISVPTEVLAPEMQLGEQSFGNVVQAQRNEV